MGHSQATLNPVFLYILLQCGLPQQNMMVAKKAKAGKKREIKYNKRTMTYQALKTLLPCCLP